MILELGQICNVYLVYLLLRSNSILPNLSSPNIISEDIIGTSSSNGLQDKKNNIEYEDNSSTFLKEKKIKDGTDYHLTTRRLSKVLLGRVTSLVLISQLIYLIYWWGVLPSNGLINNINYLELYLFDGQVLLSSNTLLFMIIINVFAFLSYQVCINGFGSLVSIDGIFVNNKLNSINPNSSGLLSGEASLIILGNIIGIDQLLTSNNQILALISWEQINICIYSLISINNNKTKVLSNSIKYFIISAVSTTIFIQGITLIYMETGSFNYTCINYQVNMEPNNFMLQQGTLFLYFTIMQKLGGAPLHFWAPDLYTSQPSNITQWLLIVPKLGNLLLLLNLYNLFNNPISNPSIDYGFTQLGSEFIMITGVLSMLVGSISLLSQVKVKRFFAYSSICHVGFLLQCLAFNGFSAYMHYLIIYGQTTLNIFILISLFNSNNLSFFLFTSTGQGSNNFKTGISFFILFSLNLFSLAGMPPLAGFFAKLGVQGSILSDISTGTNYFIPGILIILLFIQASVISAYNYLRLIALQLNISLPQSTVTNSPEALIVNTLTNVKVNSTQISSKPQNSSNYGTLGQLHNATPYMFDLLSIGTIALVLYAILIM